MMDDVAALAKQIKLPGASPKMVRIGVVTAKQVTTITVDGNRTMRFHGLLANYTVGKQVTWINEGSTPFVLGQLL